MGRDQLFSDEEAEAKAVYDIFAFLGGLKVARKGLVEGWLPDAAAVVPHVYLRLPAGRAIHA